MRRIFCDACGDELGTGNENVAGKPINGDRLFPMAEGRFSRPRVKFTVTAIVSHADDHPGDLCKTCVFVALDSADPRPRAAEDVA